ncbi:GFA family protein [Mesorhizobium sp. M1380]|uniref:GFA family protein n=1 Tax=Mesorhizobium sp. M1380 TaxID=2957093 RepID=UPI003337D7B7
MDEQVRTGGCLCGAASIRLKGQPTRVGICHCHDCRRTSGSAFVCFAVWPRSSYEDTGNLHTFAGRSFCPTCGSRLVSLREDEAEVMIGSLDQAPSNLIPDYELWIGRREPWLLNLELAVQFEHDWEPRKN